METMIIPLVLSEIIGTGIAELKLALRYVQALCKRILAAIMSMGGESVWSRPVTKWVSCISIRRGDAGGGVTAYLEMGLLQYRQFPSTGSSPR